MIATPVPIPPQAYAPLYPATKEEQWYFVLGDTPNNAVLGITRKSLLQAEAIGAKYAQNYVSSRRVGCWDAAWGDCLVFHVRWFVDTHTLAGRGVHQLVNVSAAARGPVEGIKQLTAMLGALDMKLVSCSASHASLPTLCR